MISPIIPEGISPEPADTIKDLQTQSLRPDKVKTRFSKLRTFFYKREPQERIGEHIRKSEKTLLDSHGDPVAIRTSYTIDTRKGLKGALDLSELTHEEAIADYSNRMAYGKVFRFPDRRINFKNRVRYWLRGRDGPEPGTARFHDAKETLLLNFPGEKAPIRINDMRVAEVYVSESRFGKVRMIVDTALQNFAYEVNFTEAIDAVPNQRLHVSRDPKRGEYKMINGTSFSMTLPNGRKMRGFIMNSYARSIEPQASISLQVGTNVLAKQGYFVIDAEASPMSVSSR